MPTQQTMPTQQQLAQQFRALHTGGGAFVIPNVWDGASARMMQGLGFKALATSSGACAAVLGRLDGQITREEAIAHARAIIATVTCPVSADLETGFGHEPAAVAETIRRAAACGLVGGSIEDASGDTQAPIYGFDHAVERVAAAVAAARALPVPFMLTARAENFVNGRADLDDTIRRLQAFERAGADVLFAPGLPDLEAVRAVCAALRAPVNFMVGIRGRSFSVAQLQAAGVKRISLSTSLYMAAMTGVLMAAREVSEQGTFSYVEHLMRSAELEGFLSSG